MINPKSLDNLRSFNMMTKERRTEIARKAGKLSGEKRRKMKQEREIITALTKYGSALRLFLELSELPPDEFDRRVKQAMKEKS